MSATTNNSYNSTTIDDSRLEEANREMEFKESTHARQRRPSMLEEAEAHAGISQRVGDNLHPDQANRTSSRSPVRSQEPEIRRMSGHFSTPHHLETHGGEKKSGTNWKGNILRNLK